MRVYPNNFIDLAKLKANGSVLVAKSNAEHFLLTCIMAKVDVKFELENNKIKFSYE